MLENILHDATSAAQWVLLVVLLIIIIGPLILERFKLPGMLGLVLGGMLLGPYVLGWLPEGSLDGLGGIGILYLMFMAGLELDLNLFNRYRKVAISFGLLTFTLPFFAGMGASGYLGLTAAVAILMGSVWASHTLVSYPQVRQAGLASNKAVATSVGATVITDTFALVVLAVISGTVGAESQGGGANPALILIKIALALAVLALYCLWILPKAAHWFFTRIGFSRVTRFVFLICGMLSAGLLAHLFGIEGLVGAFFAGLGLNRFVPNGGRLMEYVEFFGTALFIPAFLVSVGMLINPVLLFSLETLQLSLIFAVALVVGKSAAALIAGKMYKFSLAEVALMFSLTIAQAAATLAATLVGFEIGLFGEEIVNAVLLVVMVSLVISSLGARLASVRVRPEVSLIQPPGNCVVVVVRPSDMLHRLMTIAAEIARPDAGVVLPVVIVAEQDVEKERSQGEDLLKQADEFGAEAAADVESILRIDTSLHHGITTATREHNGSLVLAEWQQRPDLQQLVFGSELDQIGSLSSVPMVIGRFSESKPERVVLVVGASDGSPGYKVDLQVAFEVVKRIARSRSLPTVILYSSKELPIGLELPADIEMILIDEKLASVLAKLKIGDMVVTPWAAIRNTLRSSQQLIAKASDQVTVLITAGPHRFSITGNESRHEMETILSFGRGL